MCESDGVDAVSEVVEAAQARAVALATRDRDALIELLHPAFRWTSHTGQVFSRDAYIERNTSGTLVWRSQDLSDVQVSVVGETAVLLAEVRDVVENDGHPETLRMPVTQVWVHASGRWTCLAGHAGPRRA